MVVNADLPADATAAAAARRHVEGFVSDAQLRQDALIVVSELVANAWQHGDPPISLVLEQDSDAQATGRLLICVTNRRRAGSTSVPLPSDNARPDRLGGRGVDLVRLLAADWGWQAQGQTMTVWARIE